MNIQEKVINTEIYKGRQTVYFKQVLSMNDKKLLIDIQSDSFENQSHARISLFDGDKWNIIHTILNMNTPYGLIYKENDDYKWSNNDIHYFEKDINELKEIAKQIIF